MYAARAFVTITLELALIVVLLSMAACSITTARRNVKIPPLSITSSTLCKEIKYSGYLNEPIQPTRNFSPGDDEEVVSYIRFSNLTGEHHLHWKWYTPTGRLYQTSAKIPLKAPMQKIVRTGAASHALPIKSIESADLVGKWKVKIFLDDALTRVEFFTLLFPDEERIQNKMTDIDFGSYHALVIGINNYMDMKKLASANWDAKEVARKLKEKYNFKTTLLLDATRAEILLALDRMRATLGANDNLLIYYAGHGVLDSAGDEGYWLPADASPENRLNWISSATLTTNIKAMLAKHVMVVADSCYSGKLTRTSILINGALGMENRPKDYYYFMARKKARTVMCSGGLEPVLDGQGRDGHSVFAAAFLEALENNKGVLDATELFVQLRRPVVLNSDQTPEYGDIRKSGHDGGDFLFVSKELFQ